MRKTSGLDWQARIMGDNSGLGLGTGEFAPANWMAVSADTTPPVATPAPLTGEVTDGSLRRAQATFAHTSGASSYTLTKTFTCDRAFSPRKMALYHLPEGGDADFETLLEQHLDLVDGEMFTVTETITI